MLNYKHVLDTSTHAILMMVRTTTGSIRVSYRLKIKWYIHNLLWDMILKALKWISMLKKI